MNSQAIQTGRITEMEGFALKRAAAQLAELKLEIDDTVPLTIELLRAKCVQSRALGKLDILFVDYAGLMDAPGESEYEQHKYLSRGLKKLAMELNIPGVVAHQLNRKGHEGERPQMHHLRGSGTWEQDANIVVLLYPDKARTPTMDFDPIVMDVAKQRSGPTGTINLMFRRKTTRFELATSEEVK